MNPFYERPIDRAERAASELAAVSMLVASCGDLHAVSSNDFSTLLGHIRDDLRQALAGLSPQRPRHLTSVREVDDEHT